jgi:hypothetical protein
MTRNEENTEMLAPDIWDEALEDFTKIHQGDAATIEIVDQTLGDQVEASEVLPLAYVEYDRQDDVVVVALGGQTARFPVVLRRIIEHPQKVFISPPRPSPTEAIAIADRGGTATLVTLRARPALWGE